MKIYLILFQDRHSDPGVYSTTDKEKAINYAEKQAHNLCTRGYVDISLKDQLEGDWIYRAGYSCEGDNISVKEVDIESLPEIFTI